MNPLPLEKEFQVLAIRRRFAELSREELEEFLSEALVMMSKLTHQLSELKDYLLELERQGKTQ